MQEELDPFTEHQFVDRTSKKGLEKTSTEYLNWVSTKGINSQNNLGQKESKKAKHKLAYE